MTATWPEGVAVRYHTAGGYIVNIADDGRIGHVDLADEQSATADDCWTEQLADRVLAQLAQ